MSLTYASYLELDQLLSVQHPRSAGPEHDEMLFIVIHQVYELWFKQLLHEADHLINLFQQNERHRILHTMRRILTIFKTLVSQIDILETMTPLEFLSFRGRLESASGFQSYQFRELEFLLGHKRHSMIHHHRQNPVATARLEARFQQPTLWDAFLHFLQLNGYPVPADLLQRDVTESLRPSTAVQAILKQIYQQNPDLLNVCERLVDLDEALQEWRYRHVKMVERTIGNKKGTGGSSGTGYLQSTIGPLFPDLWAIRADL